MKNLDFHYDFALRQRPENPRCWKEKIAWFLRRIADQFDRRESLALRFHSDPELSYAYRNACIERGMKNAYELMAEAVKYESMDRFLESQHPELWKEAERNS